MKLRLSVQYVCRPHGLPADSAIARWARAGPEGLPPAVALGVRLVGERGKGALNGVTAPSRIRPMSCHFLSVPARHA